MNSWIERLPLPSSIPFWRPGEEAPRLVRFWVRRPKNGLCGPAALLPISVLPGSGIDPERV